MINKKTDFNSEDVSILEMFCELSSTAIQNFDIFNRNLEERTYLLSILNSIKSHIFVFNKEGVLDYCNSQISKIFGVDE